MNSYRKEDEQERKSKFDEEIRITINSVEKSKGKSALDNLHKNLVRENEKDINLKISDIYGVDYDEANDIHINYHTTRLLKSIEKSKILSEMKSFIENAFDIQTLSSKVASGEITESVCIDMLINAIKNKKETKIKDRYINFYG